MINDYSLSSRSSLLNLGLAWLPMDEIYWEALFVSRLDSWFVMIQSPCNVTWKVSVWIDRDIEGYVPYITIWLHPLAICILPSNRMNTGQDKCSRRTSHSARYQFFTSVPTRCDRLLWCLYVPAWSGVYLPYFSSSVPLHCVFSLVSFGASCVGRVPSFRSLYAYLPHLWPVVPSRIIFSSLTERQQLQRQRLLWAQW